MHLRDNPVNIAQQRGFSSSHLSFLYYCRKLHTLFLTILTVSFDIIKSIIQSCSFRFIQCSISLPSLLSLFFTSRVTTKFFSLVHVQIKLIITVDFMRIHSRRLWLLTESLQQLVKGKTGE